MQISDYTLYGAITLILSMIFSMGGSGSGIALIPILSFLGLDFLYAKAYGLFAGATTTITSSVMNIKRGAVNIIEALPIAIAMLIFAPVGAYLSKFVNQELVKLLFALLLLYSASMMLFGKKKAIFRANSRWILFLVGTFVGVLAGLLGVGGGNILIPLLVMLGFEPKKVATTVSFVVPFSALGSFATYASMIDLDYILLFVIAICAIVGGYIGNFLMHFKLNQKQVKKLLAVMLYILAIKMLWHLV